MASWLEDLIGKQFWIDNVILPLVGRLHFLSGVGITLTPQVVEGDENEPTELKLTVAVSDEIAALVDTETATGAADDPDYELYIQLPMAGEALENGYWYRFEVTIDLTYSGGDVRASGISELYLWRGLDGTMHGLDVIHPPPRALNNANTAYSVEHCEITAGDEDGIPFVEVFRDYSDAEIPVTARVTSRMVSKTQLTADPGA